MAVTKILVLRTSTGQQDEEIQAIRDGIILSGSQAWFDIKDVPDVTTEQLNSILIKDEPHIVHFAGHGARDRYLFLPSKDGLDRPVPAGVWASLFSSEASPRLRCVVLNSCYSDGVAEALVDYVDCAVGMSSDISNSGANAFANGFYFAVGSRLTAQAAIVVGRNQIRLAVGDTGDWKLPQIRTNPLVDSSKYIIAKDIETPLPPQVGLLHGKYALIETLDRGPIARTDVMEDVQLRRRVVVKTLIEPATKNAFLDEVADLVKVSKHQNIVAIYGSWLHDTAPHYVREYADGRTLRSKPCLAIVPSTTVQAWRA